jgi:hypothetical protein
MDPSSLRHPILPALLALSLLAAAARPVAAAESQKEILDGLRASGHYDEAISYLQHARANPDTPQAFAETIDYELAVTEIDAAFRLVETERDKRLQQAQDLLTKFLAEHPQHGLAAVARSQLGNLLFDRGRLRRKLAEQLQGPTWQQHMQAARELLHQADELWSRVDSAADGELRRIASARGNGNEVKPRDPIHRRQVEARLARAWVQYEVAQTFAVGSGERTSALEDAGTRFDAIYDQQRQRLAGYYGELGRGMCWKDLGQGEKAFAIFEKLLVGPDDPADFHAIRGKATVQALETALEPEIKKFKPAVDIARHWLESDRPRPTSGDVDVAIRFLGGEAALDYARTLPAASSDLRTQQLDWARQQFQIVAAAEGPYQAKARSRLLDPALGPAANPAEAVEPGSFADARNRAKSALDRYLAALAAQKAVEQHQSGAAAAANDQDSQRQRRQQIASAQSEALKYCRLATDLRTAAVSAEDYDTVRYYLAHLRYASGEIEEAAALGEAVAQASSDSSAARQAARIGLAAREALLRHAGDDSQPTATERLQVLAERIIERWGNRVEADDARGVLIDLALADGRLDKAELDKAEEYLQQMSQASPRRDETALPRRAEAEMNVGQALWRRAQQLTRTSTLTHDHTEEAEKTTAHAAGLLSDGIAQFRKAAESGPVENGAVAKAMLALAQIHTMSGEPAKALILLEDPMLAADREANSLAIVAALATEQLDKARLCLQKLEASLPPAANANSARQTLETCLGIHRLLKQHLTQFRNLRQADLSKKIVQNIETFLATPAELPGAGRFFVAAWRAEAFAGMADGLDFGGLGASPAAEKQYRRAVAALQEILDRAAADAKSLPSPEIMVALRIELARCLRRLSDHQQAFYQLRIVLRDHPLMVDAQVEAAYTYQSWGDEKPECLELAIQGGKQFQEVWGWGELARRVQSEVRFRDVFFEARYNLALCRFHQAQIATDTFQRIRLVNAAENDILATQRTAPDMGGAVWYDRFNDLLKRIQRLADRPAVGLSAK